MRKLDLGANEKNAEKLGGFGGSEVFYLGKEMDDEIYIRVIYPLENQNGMVSFQAAKWWLGSKPIMSPENKVDGFDVVEDELDLIKQEYEDDTRMLKSINKKTSNNKDFKKSYEQLFLGVPFDFDFNDELEIKDIWISDLTREEAYEARMEVKKGKYKNAAEAIDAMWGIKVSEDENIGTEEPIDFDKLKKAMIGDGEIKIISTGVQAMKEVISTFSKKAALKHSVKCDLLTLDNVRGVNTMVFKKGKGLNTKYSSDADTFPMEMPDFYDNDNNKPDIIKFVEAQIKPEAWIRAYVRFYVLGEEEPADDYGQDGAETSNRRQPKTTERRRRRDDDDEPTETRKRKDTNSEPVDTGRKRKDTNSEPVDTGRKRRDTNSEPVDTGRKRRDAPKEEEKPTGRKRKDTEEKPTNRRKAEFEPNEENFEKEKKENLSLADSMEKMEKSDEEELDNL